MWKERGGNVGGRREECKGTEETKGRKKEEQP
jgi:hypothetical protein